MYRTLLILFSFLLLSPAAVAQDDNLPVEILVTGKQPGPPMWRVKNGDNTLYIFAFLSPIPKNIIWESERVEKVISEAQEYITRPEVDVSVSPLVMWNPINIVRGIGLGKRISRNEDKATLEEVLPPELYQRFSTLKAEYFPRDKAIEKVRPLLAGGRMITKIRNKEGLEPGDDILKKIKRLAKRNRGIKTTEILYSMKLEGGFKDIASRVEDMMASLPWELELSCFERQLTQMEEDIEEMQYRASAWAQGYVQEFKFIPLTGDEDDDCTRLIFASSEQTTAEEILNGLNSLWLDAADNALQTNQTTFAVLDINQLLLDHGLVAQLKERGYEVIEP